VTIPRTPSGPGPALARQDRGLTEKRGLGYERSWHPARAHGAAGEHAAARAGPRDQRALTLSAPASQKDELTYLRLSRDRARLVLYACKRILADREADHGDIMAIAASLREEAAQLRDDAYDHGPVPS
jgi:hypothetical protein